MRERTGISRFFYPGLYSTMTARYFLMSLLLTLACFSVQAQKVIPLYTGTIPNSRDVSDEESGNADRSILFKTSKPTLTIYLPEASQATGTAMVICPGGGYGALMMKMEGADMAQRLVKWGIAAFVLKYRLPSDRTMIDKSIGPLQDAQQAIKLVRMHAAEWHVDPAKIGIMGFSAGGHLASTAGTHYSQPLIDDKENISLRPDFMVLVYPVISFTDAIGHIGSRDNLLGKDPSAEQIRKFSNEQQVTPQTPPAFLVQAEDDSVVQVANSIQFYEALQRNKVGASLHIYTKGGHGFLKIPPRDVWMKDLKYWMRNNGWLPSK